MQSTNSPNLATRHITFTFPSLFTYGHIVCISLVVAFQVAYIQGMLLFKTFSAVVYCIHHYFVSFFIYLCAVKSINHD